MRESQESKIRIKIVIGPTASGKSAYAINLAKAVGGEIISADSVQVYKHLDIGSGKVTASEMEGVPHHGLDLVEPETKFTVAEWLIYTEEKISEIVSRGHIPIICGGTGLYIDALLYGITDNPPPDYEQREFLKNVTLIEIQNMLKSKNLEYFESLNHSEQNNKERLIRKLELTDYDYKNENKMPRYDAEIISLEPDLVTLENKIRVRLEKRLEDDVLVSEIRDLIHNKKISSEWLKSLGLEYKYVTEYIEGKIEKDEMYELLSTKIYQYAKRQITWNKRYRDFPNIQVVR